jgi:hypothetical protein
MTSSYIPKKLRARVAAQARHRCGYCLYATLDMFSFLFSVPTFFTDIGDAALEESSRIAGREKPLGYGFFRRSTESPLDYEREIVPPRFPVRGFAALYFSGIALDAIWTHELSHAVHGGACCSTLTLTPLTTGRRGVIGRATSRR